MEKDSLGRKNIGLKKVLNRDLLALEYSNIVRVVREQDLLKGDLIRKMNPKQFCSF